ncbi:MAG: hypothetical protein Q7K16_02330 [Candidatus Azambacteria bacterium]|nr:hypothetical protein [Candidatus Azambacteria bacterium]
MKYYILNINYDKKSQVDYWLGDRRLAPVFYGNSALEQIRSGVDHKIPPQAYVDAKRFVHTFDKINESNIIFSIGDRFVYVFKQGGLLKEIKENSYKKDLIKCFEIKLLKKVEIKDCPLVLVSIKANRYIQSGTFRDLNDDKYLGNTKALEHLLNGKVVVVPNYARYLQCLSSLEFETLIAKYLEEKGLFVPAYKGGFLKNYDLFCRNLGTSNIILGDMVIRPKDSLSVQVKLNITHDHKKDLERVDLFFCINSTVKDKKIFNWRYLEKNISGNTKTWIETVLDWVKFNDKK